MWLLVNDTAGIWTNVEESPCLFHNILMLIRALDCVFNIVNRYGVRNLAEDSQACSPQEYSESPSLPLREFFWLGGSINRLVGVPIQSPQVRISKIKWSLISEHTDRAHSVPSSLCALLIITLVHLLSTHSLC